MSKTLERIRKLLNLAQNDSASPNEADTAKRLAEQLMAAAGISEADLDLSGATNLAATVGVQKGSSDAGASWVRFLAVAIGRITGCKLYLEANNTIVWIGTQDQRDAAIELHAWVMRQVELMAESTRKHIPEGVSRRAFMNAYRLGVANEICAKARSLVAAKPTVTDSKALTVLSAIEKRQDELFPKAPMRKVGKAHFSSGKGFRAGEFDGKNVQLQNSVSSPARKRLT